MTSRDTILQRVRSELSKGPPVAPPPVPEVWPRENPAPAAMAERFAKELADVHGEVIRCATMEDARRQLAELVAQAQWTSLGAMDRPMVREAVGRSAAGPGELGRGRLAAAADGRAVGQRDRGRRAAGRHRLVPDRLPHAAGPAAVLPAAGVRGDRPGGSVGRASCRRPGRRSRPAWPIRPSAASS